MNRNRIAKRRIVVAGALAAALLLRDPLALSPYSAWLISIPLVFWCAWPMHQGLLRGIRLQQADSEMLISIAIWAGFLYTTAVEAVPEFFPAGTQQTFFGTISALVLFPLLGRWWGELLLEPSGEAVWRLTRRIPATARVVRGGEAAVIPCGEVGVGETVRVQPGEQVPLDGEVSRGRARVDESLWTGSEVPVEKSRGSRLFGGSLNKSGELELRVSGSGPATSLARIVAGIREGFGARDRRPGPADRVCSGYAPAVVIIAAVSSLVWSWSGYEPRLQHAFAAFAFVLITACPWSIGVIAPAALAAGIRRAKDLGIRVRDPGVLRPSPDPDVLVIDKTGVLTEGNPRLVEIVRTGGMDEAAILRLASAAGRSSGHPFSQALLRRSGERGGPSPDVESMELFPGQGVEAEIGGQRVRVGTLPWLAGLGIAAEGGETERSAARPDPLLGFSVDEALEALLSFQDDLRPDAAAEIRRLEEMGVEVVLVSGDREASVRSSAQALGIRRWFSEAGSKEKLAVISELRGEGRCVAMAGEGLLDAPALSHADIGIAFDHGSAPEPDRNAFDLSSESADLVVDGRSLEALREALALVRGVRRTAQENAMWSFGLQLPLIPVAAGALLPGLGIWFHPVQAAAAGLLGWAAVAWNSRRRLLR